MLSVVHILSSLQVGGAERVTIALAQLQRQEGLDAQILCLGSDQDFLVETLQDIGIPLTVSEIGESRFKRYPQILKTLKKFDVVHIHSPRVLIYIAPLVPLFAEKKIIYTRHGVESLSSIKWKLLHKAMSPFVNYVTCVAQSGYDVFKEKHNWNADKMVVINNGVPVQDEFSLPEKLPIRFGSVGRMVELKGQPILLEAVKLLAEEFGDEASSKFTLGFYGGGPLESQLHSEAADIQPGIVEFYGELTDVEQIYDGIDVLVVASQSEGLSMVIMEAMARAKPAIATDVGGNGNLVYDGKTGLLVPYGSAEALADAMRKTIQDLDLVKQYGVEARNMINENFSLLNAHRAYLKCYTA
tara:strand:- start:1357 stop:2424 length:1068 start_codon:yes stop_codon:yes gene_type:complete